MNVLIVGDDGSVARLLRHTMLEAGHQVQATSDGISAISLATDIRFDLILLDLTVPRLDGFGVIEWLRARGVDTPIHIITARDAEADKIRGLDCGADDYILKPFHVGKLPARSRALMRRTGTSSPPLGG